MFVIYDFDVSKRNAHFLGNLFTSFGVENCCRFGVENCCRFVMTATVFYPPRQQFSTPNEAKNVDNRALLACSRQK